MEIVIGLVCLAIGAVAAYFIATSGSNSKIQEANRTLEAREAYEQFCSRLISLTGMPPSRGLRDLAARLFPSDTPE